MANDVSSSNQTNASETIGSIAALPRWWWIVMFAAFLIGLGTKAKAQEAMDIPATIQLDAVLPGPVEPMGDDPKWLPNPRNSRPQFVELSAALANFDQDAESDGWIATIVLRDANGNPVAMRSQATFELKPGRFAVDNVTFVAGEQIAQRWFEPLSFDPDGVAHVRLKLSNHSRKSIGQSTMFIGTRSLAQTVYASGSPFETQRLSNSDRFRDSPTDGFIGPDFPFNPVLGALSVRVSVPSQGTFDAVNVVRLNSPVVDFN